ncbi:MAG: hypothetical protein H0T76_04350 [Nannocystis sp.]|nr:hypothetical protein [Nannocystis sp.]MBA3545693.1 hypothetical protein [Nannocystis sp.]
MSLLAPVLAALLVQLQQPAQPAPLQRPTQLQQPAEPVQPSQPSVEPVTGRPSSAPLAAEPAPLEPEPATVVSAPVPEDSEPMAPPRVEPAGPPYYSAADMQTFRGRQGLDPTPPTSERRPMFRCWIADPTCGLVVEINATSAYAYRARQKDFNSANEFNKWSSARVQYDIWVSIPTMTETRGKFRYTRLSLGPKGGVIASDSKEIWGNVGIAGRYWFSRKRFAPSLEFTSALVFKLAGTNRNGNFDNARGPLGFTADVGFGIGGFGSIVVGGQFDSPLAREDILPAETSVVSGMFFVGFRGNILWGLPAAAAVGTHAAATRLINPPK